MNKANVDKVMLANTYITHNICRKRYRDMIACMMEITCETVPSSDCYKARSFHGNDNRHVRIAIKIADGLVQNSRHGLEITYRIMSFYLNTFKATVEMKL